MTIKEIREYRKVPARRGMRCEVEGDAGVIVGARGGYLRVRFDDEIDGENTYLCHPTWEITYIHADGRRESFGVESKGNPAPREAAR